MLRPLYSRFKNRNNSSRLYDDNNHNKMESGSNGIRTIGAISNAPGRKKFSRDDTLNNTSWEMDDYYSAETAKGKLRSTATADVGDEVDDTSSEKGLTKQGNKLPVDGIGVKTTWTVTRNQ
jgi:hypothetical protein